MKKKEKGGKARVKRKRAIKRPSSGNKGPLGAAREGDSDVDGGKTEVHITAKTGTSVADSNRKRIRQAEG